MPKYVETTHPKKIMGLYLNLAKALNALDEAGEDPRGADMSAVFAEGISGRIEWSREHGYTVVQA